MEIEIRKKTSFSNEKNVFCLRLLNFIRRINPLHLYGQSGDLFSTLQQILKFLL